MELASGRQWTRTEIVAIAVTVVVVVAVGWLQYARLRERALEAAVRGNAHTTQLAAEIYAAQNADRYAIDPLDLVVYYPGGKPLANPYSGGQLLFDGAPGDLRYTYRRPGADYRIVAFGRDRDGAPRALLELSSARWRSAGAP
jgi:hypothetical protein